MTSAQKTVYVYDSFSSNTPSLLGLLYISVVRGTESYAFEYSRDWLSKTNLSISLDPELMPFPGRQFPAGKNIFGLFSDASPDRVGGVF